MDSDVLVVGAGPCGAVLANLLGVYGVHAVVVERATAIVDFPRAVGIDDESLRSLQGIGLVEEVLAHTTQDTPIRYYTSWGRCFAHVKPSAQPFGWPRRNLFLQPLLEATLRAGLRRFDSLDVRYGSELLGFEQDRDGVTAQLRDPAGGTSTMRSRYLVGADGGRSSVRRALGVDLTGDTAPVKWLVVDVADDRLDAPYSAVHCHPARPVLTVPLPYRHRRWEFKVQPGDDEEALSSPAKVLELLAPHYGHLPLPRLVSSRIYLHHSRTARTFAVRRAFLVGDAAHLQPPFFGQGMNSGIRDVTNLAWKLAAVTRGGDEAVLGTYDTERRHHAAEMVSFATRVGQLYSPRNRATERARDMVFRGLQAVPGGKEYILQMKYKPMPRYTAGVVVRRAGVSSKDDPVGRMYMQPVVETADRRQLRLDDAIGPWFALIGIGVDPVEHLGAADRAWWDGLGAHTVRVDPARSGPHPGERRAPTPDGTDQADHHRRHRLEDVRGGFRDWLLAQPGTEVVVLRPDRYVAAVTDRRGLAAVTDAMRALIGDAVVAAGA